MDRDQFYMEIAKLYAKRSTCDRAQVGAIITVSGRLISAGYNGSFPGQPHCDEVGHIMVNNHCKRTIHAEVNALDFMGRTLPYKFHDTTMYVTHLPCEDCVAYIIRAHHRPRILYYDIAYGDNVELRIKTLIGAGIDVRQLQPLPTE